MATHKTTSSAAGHIWILKRQASLPLLPLLAHKLKRANLQFHGILPMLKLEGSLEVISPNPSFYRADVDTQNENFTYPKSHNGEWRADFIGQFRKQKKITPDFSSKKRFNVGK